MKTDRGSRQSSNFAAVVPVYNGGEFIESAIESILNQSFFPSQIIVVDDGSTDDTARIVKKFGDKATLIRNKRIGVSAARNAETDYAKEALIYSRKGYNTGHQLKLHGELPDAPANAHR